MERTLRISRRPFIVFAIVFGAVELLVLISFARSGPRPDLLEVAGIPIILYAVTMALLCSVRITVSSDGLAVTRWYIRHQFIAFADVGHCDVQVLAERDWPVMLTIHGRSGRKILATLGLKSIKQEDAAWVCALPELKCITHPGLTRGS